MIDKRQARMAVDKAASSYDMSAVLQREIGERMLSRLDYIKLQPEVIVDAGAGTGLCSRHLLKRYPKAQVIALVDIIPRLLHGEILRPAIQVKRAYRSIRVTFTGEC